MPLTGSMSFIARMANWPESPLGFGPGYRVPSILTTVGGKKKKKKKGQYNLLIVIIHSRDLGNRLTVKTAMGSDEWHDSGEREESRKREHDRLMERKKRG